MEKFCCSFVVLTAVILSLPVQAAVILMKNGDRLTGTITQQDKDILLLNLPYSGQVQLPRSQIERIEQQASEPVVQPPFAAKTKAVLVANQPLQHYSIDLTAAKKRNQSKTDNLGVKTAFELRDEQWRLTFDAKYDYETSNELTKSHKYALNPGADYFFQQALFWRNKIDYAQNFLALDEKQLDLSTGLGYSFYDTAALRIEFIALAGLQRAYLKETAGLEPFIGEQQILNFRHLQLEWDLRYLWVDSNFEIFSEGSYLRPFNQPLQHFKFKQEINLSSGVHYYLTERIRLSFSVDLDWSDIDVYLTSGDVFSATSHDLQQKLSIGAKF